MRHRSTLAIATTVAVALVAVETAAADTVTFRLGHVDAAESHSGIGVEAFAEAVERLSDGAMQVNVFHAGQLGSIPEQMTNVMTGAQDMHLLYPEFLSARLDEARVISLPYLFEDLQHLRRFYTSELWASALDKLEAMGAVVLDPEWTWEIRDPRGFISVKPAFTPEDLEGVRMRIWEDQSAIATWEGFGAETEVVPRPEMYLAFRQGIIEAGPETLGIAYDQKNVEMAKYWIRTAEYHQIINVIMNVRTYESLSDEQRGILADAMRDAAEVFTATTERNFNLKMAAAQEEHGVHVIFPALGAWRERGADVVDQLLGDGYVPQDYIEAIRALVE